MNRRQLAKNLTAHGYGAKAGYIEALLEKLNDQEIADLMYVCQRASEKLGEDAFNDEVN